MDAIIAALQKLVAELQKFIAASQPTPPLEPLKMPSEAPEAPIVTPTPSQPIQPLKWGTYKDRVHSVRVICDQEGLSPNLKEILCACIEVESHFNPTQKSHRANKDGSYDWGIVQVNSSYHIGQGKSFPSIRYVLDNPEVCVRWMARNFKEGRLTWWVSYSNKMYKQYMKNGKFVPQVL